MSTLHPTLFMAVLGATPPGRTTEQHDIFFGISHDIKSLKKDMYDFWPNAGQLHIDSYRAVTRVGGYEIKISEKKPDNNDLKLFFLNLGGYRPGDMEEYHHKILVVAKKMSQAIRIAKKTAFYKEYGFKGAESHIDEKYALDVDDMHKVEDLLPASVKERYSIEITPTLDTHEDDLYVGYVKLGSK